MIVWRLRGYADPDGEFAGGEVTCAIERAEDGYRLLVAHDGEIQIHESHAAIDTARGKADLLRDTLLKQGWIVPTNQPIDGVCYEVRGFGIFQG